MFVSEDSQPMAVILLIRLSVPGWAAARGAGSSVQRDGSGGVRAAVQLLDLLGTELFESRADRRWRVADRDASRRCRAAAIPTRLATASSASAERASRASPRTATAHCHLPSVLQLACRSGRRL
jgi:hypothetical protein